MVFPNFFGKRVSSVLHQKMLVSKVFNVSSVSSFRSFSLRLDLNRGSRKFSSFQKVSTTSITSPKVVSLFHRRSFSDVTTLSPSETQTQENAQTVPPPSEGEPPKKVQRDIKNGIHLNFKLNTFVKERNFAEAEKIFQHMLATPELSPNIITYTTMINSYRKQGDLNRIDALLEEMKQKNIKPYDLTYCALIEAFGKKGELKRMVAFYDEMKEHKFKPNLQTFVIMQNCLLTQNDADTQRRILTEMKKLNVPPNDKMYNYLLESYNRRDEIEPMMKTFEEMKKLGLQPDEETFHSMISAWYRVGNLDQLVDFFKKMKMLYIRPKAESYNMLMELLIRKEDYEGVLNYYQDLKTRKSKPDTRTLTIVTDILNKLNSPAEKIMELVKDTKVYVKDVRKNVQ